MHEVSIKGRFVGLARLSDQDRRRIVVAIVFEVLADQLVNDHVFVGEARSIRLFAIQGCENLRSDPRFDVVQDSFLFQSLPEYTFQVV